MNPKALDNAFGNFVRQSRKVRSLLDQGRQFETLNVVKARRLGAEIDRCQTMLQEMLDDLARRSR
jgi:ribosomal protein L16 Arg81 hydroxylase